jgi:hypothetical protein
MTINSRAFRVREGENVNLKKWPTLIDPVCQSTEQYSELLEEHVVQRVLPGRMLDVTGLYA